MWTHSEQIPPITISPNAPATLSGNHPPEINGPIQPPQRPNIVNAKIITRHDIQNVLGYTARQAALGYGPPELPRKQSAEPISSKMPAPRSPKPSTEIPARQHSGSGKTHSRQPSNPAWHDTSKDYTLSRQALPPIHPHNTNPQPISLKPGTPHGCWLFPAFTPNRASPHCHTLHKPSPDDVIGARYRCFWYRHSYVTTPPTQGPYRSLLQGLA